MKNIFENFAGFGSLFSSAQDQITKQRDNENELTYKNSKVFTYEEDGSDTSVVAGGSRNNNGSASASATTSLEYQRDRINKYRQAFKQPEVTEAVDHIINEIVSCDDDEVPVALNLDKVELSEKVKQTAHEAFTKILQLMDFNNNAYERMVAYYVDGRQAYHKIIDEKHKNRGIRKLVLLDPRTVKKMREIVKDKDENGIEVISSDRRFFIWDPSVVIQRGIQRTYQSTGQRLELKENMVAYSDSGIVPDENGFVPGFLEEALPVLNKLRTMEDAMVIYAITRAPEKRAFYLDTGSLPKKSSEEYVKSMMGRFNTAVTYNRETGEVNSSAKLMGIVEDYWIPRREGKTASSIETLQGGQQLGETSHILYFLERLYKALKVPRSRIDSGDNSNALVNIGGSELAQTTHAEIIFRKFNNRIRRRYASDIFIDLLRTELILTNVITEKEWKEHFQNKIMFTWTGDSYVTELQENEIMSQRLGNMQAMEPYLGTLFSIQTLMKDVLKMTDEQIEAERKQIEKEEQSGEYTKFNVTEGMEKPQNPLKRFE